jgi:hypothetical protein
MTENPRACRSEAVSNSPPSTVNLLRLLPFHPDAPAPTDAAKPLERTGCSRTCTDSKKYRRAPFLRRGQISRKTLRKTSEDTSEAFGSSGSRQLFSGRRGLAPRDSLPPMSYKERFYTIAASQSRLQINDMGRLFGRLRKTRRKLSGLWGVDSSAPEGVVSYGESLHHRVFTKTGSLP